MPGIRAKALAKLADNQDMNDEEYMELLRQKKQERIDRALASQEEPDYFEDVDETAMEVGDLIEEEIPLEVRERLAEQQKRRRRLGLDDEN